MDNVKLDKKEYLRRYLSKDDKKKKKRKQKIVMSSVKIIDDDEVALQAMNPMDNDEYNMVCGNEDAPVVVGNMDEKASMDFADKRRWRTIADDDTSDSRNFTKDPCPEKDSHSADGTKRRLKNDRGNEKSSLRGPKKKISKNYDSDLSPPRYDSNRTEDNSDNSDSRNFTKDSRARKHSHSVDRTKGRSKNDRRTEKISLSGSRKIAKSHENSDSDLSPPRVSNKDDRKRKSRSDSHDRRKNNDREDSNYDRSDGDRKNERAKKSRSHLRDSERRKSKSPTYGIIKNHQLKTTMDGNNGESRVRNNEELVVLRDRKTGRKRDLAEELNERREKKTRQDEIDEKYARWGKGLKQVNEHSEKIAKDKYEMSKPLARYADDADLDKELREVLRAEDPMLNYIKEKKIKNGTLEPETPSYRGSYMPNRFGIKPGYRWDGVDRSNGYEKKWFDAKNARTAIQEEAYKWSIADM